MKSFFLAFCLVNSIGFAQTISRGPYLQSPTETTITIMWRTDVPSNSTVWFGQNQQQIKTVVASKKMPPAVGNPHYPLLTGRDGLTQAEIDILVKWVDSGAPEGTPAPDERGSKKK